MAARYAKAPTYSQMQAEEARVAVRHAEIATKVALEAQAVAETALAEMHAAAQEQPARRPGVVQSIAQTMRNPEPAPVSAAQNAANKKVEEPKRARVEPQAAGAAPQLTEPVVEPQVYGIRWDPDLPVRPIELKPPAAKRAPEEFELATEDWWNPAAEAEALHENPIAVGDESTHANLIQFPRELVATRKIRPRLAEAFPGAESETEWQLSIFEVDPKAVGTISEAAQAIPEGSSSIWNRPDWSGIRLDNQRVDVLSSAADSMAATSLPVASMGLRLMAVAVDCALILASFVTVGFFAAHTFHNPPSGKTAEALGVVALAVIGLLYYAVFFALPVSTPGMKYAGIGLCTFDDQSPTRAQLRRRLGAMALSLLPVGLGLVWSIFDDDHLSWHDRYSQTYLRKC